MPNLQSDVLQIPKMNVLRRFILTGIVSDYIHVCDIYLHTYTATSLGALTINQSVTVWSDGDLLLTCLRTVLSVLSISSLSLLKSECSTLRW